MIAQRVGNRSGISGKTTSGRAKQRPSRRGRSSGESGTRRRSIARHVPLLVKITVAIVTGVLIFSGYRAASSASLFHLRTVEIQGADRVSQEAAQSIVRRDVAAKGVWQADLSEISAHLEQLLWVRSAIVTRVLPDGIRVRLTERVPRAVVRLSSGRFAWVDDEAVMLGEMKSTDDMPPFFLRGWNEDGTEAARVENLDRMRRYLEVCKLWEGPGLAERVSEVNLQDVRDVRAQLAGDDSQIEVRLGSQDMGKRLKQALEVLDEQRKTSRGSFISYVDLTQGKRAIVGFVSGAQTTSEGLNAIADAKPRTSDKKQPQTAGPVEKKAEKKDKHETERERSSRNRTR